VLTNRHLAAAYLAADRPADAWPLIRAVIGQTARTAADRRLAVEVLADTAVRVGKAAEAEAELRTYLEERRETRPRSLEVLGLRVRLGDNLLAQGRVEEATKELKAAHRVLEERHQDAWMFAEAKSLLGAALAAGRVTPRLAERLMTEGHDELVTWSAEDPSAVPPWRVERSYERVRGYYEANGKRNKLREWEGKRPASSR
jgi:predicted Zn-dependent protease